LPVDAERFQTALTGKPASPPPVAPPGEPVVEVRPRPVAPPLAERVTRESGTAEIEIIKTPPPQAAPVREPAIEVLPEPVVVLADPVAVVPEPAPVVAAAQSATTAAMLGAPQIASYAAVAAAAAAARAAAEAEAAAAEAAARAAEPEPQPAEPEGELAPVAEPESVAQDAAQLATADVAEVQSKDAALSVPVEAPPPQPAPAPMLHPPVTETGAAASQPADDLKRIRGIDQALEDRLHGVGVRRFAEIASWSSEDVVRMNQSLGLVGRIEQENWIEQADILARGSDTSYSRRQRVATAVGMAAAAASAAASATAQKSAGPDRFTRIIGIDPDTEAALYGLGFSRYSDIAQWTSADVERVEAALGRPGRVGLDNWIEQARVLARYAGEPVEARPVRLADAIRENKAARPAEPPAAVRTDVAGLRSVRSQALRGEGSAPGDRTDDLKRIRGIGVLIEKRLNALGITSYEQVANWTKADIDIISSQLDFRGRIERENWVEQARILASGGQTEFSRRVDRGEVESSKEE
jgi:predicted flap endonuclease-1-like 5' DNA nuclease